MNAKQAFREQLGTSKNIVTPNIIKRGTIKRGRVFYELSDGRGIFGEGLYGVTILGVSEEETRKLSKFSRCFRVMGEAKEYIEQLKNSL